MAIKNKKTEQLQPNVTHYCGECRRGEWIMKQEQLDHNGKPICVRCPLNEFARLRSEKACDKFL